MVEYDDIRNPCIQHTYELSSMLKYMILRKMIYVWKPNGFSNYNDFTIYDHKNIVVL